MIDYNKLSEQEQIEEIKKDPFKIQYIDNPSQLVQTEAIRGNPAVVYNIKNISEKTQMQVIELNGWTIQYIKNPSVNVILYCLALNMHKSGLKKICLNLLRQLKQK